MLSVWNGIWRQRDSLNFQITHLLQARIFLKFEECRVYIHSETHMWHNTQLKTMLVGLFGSSTRYIAFMAWLICLFAKHVICWFLMLPPMTCKWRPVIGLEVYIQPWRLIWVLWVPFVTHPNDLLVCIYQNYLSDTKIFVLFCKITIEKIF